MAPNPALTRRRVQVPVLVLVLVLVRGKGPALLRETSLADRPLAVWTWVSGTR